MNWSQVRTIFVKESLDNVRDRRTLLSSFGLSVLSPLLFIGMLVYVLNQAVGSSDSKLEAHLVGAENAPELVSWLRAQGAELIEIESDDPRTAVADGDYELILVIPPSFEEEFNGIGAHVQLVHDSSKFAGRGREFAQIRGLISGYSGLLGRMRLQVRGIDSSIINPIEIQALDTATPADRALGVLASFPFLLIFVIFMGGFYLAIDTTAGERDQGSLEPLLAQPVSRESLVVGKMSATSAFSAFALCVFLLVFAAAVPFVPFHRIGMSLSFGVTKVLVSVLVCLPLVVLSAGLLTVVAGFAKSFKEAQTYLSAVIFVPTLPIILTSIGGADPTTALMWIPSLSQSMLVNEIITAGYIPPLWLAISVVSTLAVAALFYLLAVRLYRSERLLM